jgi:hypothetical protein
MECGVEKPRSSRAITASNVPPDFLRVAGPGRIDATLVTSDPTQRPSDANTAAIRYDVVCKPSSN